MSGGSDIWVDEFGRSFCAAHRREYCHECCLAFDMINRHIEEQAGLRRPPTQVEQLASKKVMLERGIKFMLEQHNKKFRENLRYHRKELQGVERELEKLRKQGMQQEIKNALEKENIKARSHDADMGAMARANIAWGGEKAQELYEQYVAPPPSAARDPSLDPYTCSFCGKLSTIKMAACGRCKKQAYCSRTCQRSHWKAHKMICKPVEQLDPDEKALPLTWEQLETFGTAKGQRIELRYIAPLKALEGALSKTAALCKDRADISMRVELVHSIPGFGPGKVMHWKHPRFHRFSDGSGGILIRESDLANIRILS